ncbi:transcription-repair coupling factor [Lachnospiraceae bacterium 7_1_58FAA]|jgi:transcription-repair coupling factor (superfamily II helicase)|uniref:Transcription-repair-coupling factor n=1 Tax=Flavonifractor plautii TaxID=292800 RepID=A0A174SY34_FLAPL|nr:transcription-repair coupling factor [Flavonifractor plautii]EHO27370.1 transcription-repair coupling factor [Lachnospiraceae bacterium 7_1_58FAA]MCB6873930.1 transcription-repair coupling factor [Flavonifractor plautii]MCB7359195.1 transcription-repair coupling factor [Flavonifractor plautii]MCQ4660425.1 transcription-repair coupling factor [Flavonifractor plautii]MCQ4684709.1 transcription-repair coupling factor [Flavonifractor plautii]
MKPLLSALNDIPEYRSLLAAIDNGACPAAFSGLSAVHRAHFAAGIRQELNRPVVVVCADEGEAERMARDLAALSGEAVRTLSAREFTFHNAAVVSRQYEHRRLSTLRALAAGECPLLVCTVESILQRTIPKTLLTQAAQVLRMGERHDLGELAGTLAAAGYTRCEQVEGVGQFALRGGILDFFSPAHPKPVRVEFFGDEIDAMGLFDPDTQRRIENLGAAEILPAAEVLPQFTPGGYGGLLEGLDRLISQAKRRKGSETLVQTLEEDRERLAASTAFPAMDRYIALIYPVMATAADYFPEDAVVVLSESPRVAERGKSYLWQLGEDAKALMERGELAGELADFARTFEELTEVLADWPVCYLDAFTSSRYPQRPRTLLNLLTKQLPSYGASLETAVSDLAHYVSDGFRTVVLVSSEQRALNLQALLREQKMTTAVDFQLHELPGYGKAVIAVGGLTAGMEYPVGRFAVLTEGQSLLGKKRRSKPVTNRQKLGSYADLSPGDLVVHEHHGVGRFLEMTKMTVDGVQKDYVKIAYAGADVLYVPATQLDLVSKYIGSGEDAQETRKLSRLGGTDWEKAKTRAKKAVKDLAKGLIQLYAERQRQPGFAFSPDSPWMKEFEDEFEYAETDDQLRCIAEIKQDMEQARPMDRLLCGDVGYGKTEVAFRAIMKCVLDGKQAAILVPTTVLARQHYLTAKQRFAKYPVEIDVVSRFRTQTQMKDTLRRMEQGGIDLLIGTHRLFQKDVKFKDLGLLVIDEEQRFGVQHKEKLKELSKQVDVLTLSATPIPRTLNMALSGIRDMSTLEEPPMDRQPVQTYVLEHDWGVLSDAMRRELERGGQVYYLHNRVETITRTAARIKEMLGEDVAVAVAHGKMSQEELNDVMTRMSDGEVDVLVCTTIIETGIDIANANTLIIEDADHMGLAQLHQIRGRVGRSTRRAYAYLTYRRGKVLTEVASKRLGAIREFAEFGSGFKIAMRDLEIRGAGNVLGPEQSGFLLSVGYDMYLKLLEEAVLEERGEKPERPTECAADLSVAASIPDRYVPSPEQRMDLYRRIAAIRSEADADDVMDELIDRYGDPPRTVNNLISVALLRADAARNGISQIDQKGANLNFYLDQFDLQRVSALCGLEKYRSRLLFSAGERPYLALRLKKGEDALKFGRKLVEDYAKTAPAQTEG